MFNGLPQEHLHQFIASRPSSNNNINNNINSLPLVSHSSNFMISSNSSFDSYPHLILPLQHQQHDHQIFFHHHHPILHQNKTLVTNHNDLEKDIVADDVIREEEEEEDHNHRHHHHHRQAVLTVVNLEIERDRQRSATMAHNNSDHPNAVVDGGGGGDHPWTTDEVLSLLRIRSTTENWFPDFTWEHVSRKLAELGFKMRSGEKCKERFEEESRYLNNINNHSNNYTNKANVFMPFLSDLDEELYTSIIGSQKTQNPSCELLLDKRVLVEDNNNSINNVTEEVFGATEEKLVVEEEETLVNNNNNNNKRIKRKRSCFSSSKNDNDDLNNRTKFEMFKGFCEEIVNKVMSHQEEMHSKLLEDMVKRDQEKLRKEEAWKKSQVDRMNKELDFMARQQAIAGDRQATIIEFLRKFTSASTNINSNSTGANFDDDRYNLAHEKPSKSTRSVTTPSSSSTSLLRKSPNYDHITSSKENPSHVTDPNPSSDLGKRWPRDEVLALINLRCSLYTNSNGSSSSENHHHHHHRQGEALNHKAVPLWERISQGMGEKGFRRSAKRCKEKWENINKYFRKTKDMNKKRSVDSRTCPYFQQLSSLYGNGTLVETHHHCRDQDRSSDQGDHDLDNNNHDSSNSHHVLVASQGERSQTTIAPSNVVSPAFDFEF